MTNGYCVDPIIIMKSSASPGWGEPGGYTEVPVMGKIEYKTRLIREMGGEQVTAGTLGAITASVMIRLPESIDVDLGRALNHEDRIKFNDIEHTILKIDQPKAFSSYFIFKYEVYVS